MKAARISVAKYGPLAAIMVRMDGQSSARRKVDWRWMALLAFPIVAFYATAFRYLISFPLLDDFDAVLGFLLRQQSRTTLAGKLALCLTDQQAEYKFILLHVLLTLQNGLLGHISLGGLLLFGNLLVVPILFCLLRNSFTDTLWPDRAVLSLPFCYILFQLTYAELLNWTMASLSALACIAFSLLTIDGLVRGTRAGFVLACVFLTLACSAATNGFFVIPLGITLIWSDKRLRRTVCWGILSVALVGTYLLHYTRVRQPSGLPFLQRLWFFLSFAGGAIENMHRKPLHGAAIFLGFVLVCVVLHAAFTSYGRSNPFALSMAAWVLLSGATVAAFRTYLGFEQSLSGRYKIYCTLLLVFAYIYGADRVRQNERFSITKKTGLWRVAMLIALSFFGAGMITGTVFLKRRHDNLIIGRKHYLADPQHNAPDVLPGAPESLANDLGESFRATLSRAIAKGILLPPRN